MADDLKAMIVVSAKEVSLDILSEAFYRNAIAWKEMKKESKINIRTFPKDVIDAFKKANSELLNDATAESLLAKKVIESQQIFLELSKDWSKITDEDYSKLR